MSFYRGMTCKNVTIEGEGGTLIPAYTARPEGKGPFPGVVLVHHVPGWSEFYIETTRRFAHHGYLAICANLYERAGDGDPDDVAARVRAEGGVPDSQVVGDTEAALRPLHWKFPPAKTHHAAIKYRPRRQPCSRQTSISGAIRNSALHYILLLHGASGRTRPAVDRTMSKRP